MLSKSDKIIFSIIGILCLLTIIFWSNLKTVVAGKPATGQQEIKQDKKKDKKDKQNPSQTDPGISITQKWEMPANLNEISGLATIDETHLACVQDELGSIFIFNTSTGKIEKEIPFGGAGDYEGISIVGPTAWVIRSDGRLFEIENYASKPAVKEHNTPFTSKSNVEGICYDEKTNRLLIAIKGKEQNSTEYKGIYAFNLLTKKIISDPVHKIDLTHDMWKNVKGKNKIQPSGLDVHPVNGDIYIVDGPGSRLFIMDNKGANKKLYQLSNKDFPQPEGITFTASAQLYVSNEGGAGTGNILKLSLTELK